MNETSWTIPGEFWTLKSMQFSSLFEKTSISLNIEFPNRIGHLSLPRKQRLCHRAVHPSVSLFSTFTSSFLPISVRFEKGTEVSRGYKSWSWISSSIEREACRTQLLCTPFGSRHQDKSACAYWLATQHTHSSRPALFLLIGTSQGEFWLLSGKAERSRKGQQSWILIKPNFINSTLPGTICIIIFAFIVEG